MTTVVVGPITFQRVTQLVMVISLFALTFVILRISRKKPPKLRKLAALDATEEMVGRCAEMGRCFWCCSGGGSLSGASAAQTIAALSVIDYSIRFCAKLDVPINIFTVFQNHFP